MQAGVPQRDKREDKRRDKQLADCCQDARLLLSCGVWSRDGDCGCLVEYGVEMGNDAQGTPLCAGHTRLNRSLHTAHAKRKELQPARKDRTPRHVMEHVTAVTGSQHAYMYDISASMRHKYQQSPAPAAESRTPGSVQNKPQIASTQPHRLRCCSSAGRQIAFTQSSPSDTKKGPLGPTE